jgi:hypothetical protein
MKKISNSRIEKANSQLEYLKISFNNDRLRIRCRRETIFIDKTIHPATTEGLNACLAVCKAIEADIYKERFDPTLQRYGLNGLAASQVEKSEADDTNTLISIALSSFDAKRIWEQYKTLKANTPQSSKNAYWNITERTLKACPPECLSLDNAQNLLGWLRNDCK